MRPTRQAWHKFSDTATQVRPGSDISRPDLFTVLPFEPQPLASQMLVMSGSPMFGAKSAVLYVVPSDAMPLTRALEYCGKPWSMTGTMAASDMIWASADCHAVPASASEVAASAVVISEFTFELS